MIALFLSLISMVLSTIDLNLDELEFLANHLDLEECRRLVAAVHFDSYMKPNSLIQAERKIPNDVPCVQLLIHWNSAEGEGRGKTHEDLERRLRQIGKKELADWLGKTVFRELGRDLQESLKEGLENLVNSSKKPRNLSMPTLKPVVEPQDPSEWGPFDTICYAVLLVVLLAILGICLKAIANCLNCKNMKRKPRKPQRYEIIEPDYSSSDSEAKFDIRNHETAL